MQNKTSASIFSEPSLKKDSPWNNLSSIRIKTDLDPQNFLSLSHPVQVIQLLNNLANAFEAFAQKKIEQEEFNYIEQLSLELINRK